VTTPARAISRADQDHDEAPANRPKVKMPISDQSRPARAVLSRATARHRIQIRRETDWMFPSING